MATGRHAILLQWVAPWHWEEPGFVDATLQWRANERDDVSNHRCFECLPDRLFRRRSKNTSKLRATGLWVGNAPVNSPTQRDSNAENVPIWWRHHETWLEMECEVQQLRNHWKRPLVMMTSSNGNIFRFTGHLCGEFTGPHKGQWRGALMFSLICAWIKDWVNNREAGDLRRLRGHYDVIVMVVTDCTTGSRHDYPRSY